jgi:hypothetical protein
MLRIKINNRFLKEREYIIDTIFNDFLGISYQIEYHKKDDTVVVLENGNKLNITDAFFSMIDESDGYLKMKHLPVKIEICRDSRFSEKSLVVLYGSGEITVRTGEIDCGIDLIASSFFMLTRWEEYVYPARDEHDRFPGVESTAFKNNFLNRPIVNEYLELLRNMLNYLGYKGSRRTRQFKIFPTHDVDNVRYWKNPGQLVKILGGDLLRRKNVQLAYNHAAEYFRVKTGKQKDPYDTFDSLMDLSDQAGLQSHFFFIAGGTTRYDRRYPVKSGTVKEIIRRIHQRGHGIGIHPSYNTHENPVLLEQELKRLQEVSPGKITGGRQHYLRFKTPWTWQIWADVHLEWDSTMAYPDLLGFRCGTCFDFTPFNVLTRKKIKIREYPLIVSDTAFKNCSPGRMPEFMPELKALKECCQKYNGNFVILWHNSNVNNSLCNDYLSIYQALIK